MLRDISSAMDDWSSKRKAIGLPSSANILAAFDMIIDGAKSPTKPTAANNDLSMVPYQSSNAVLELLNNYARVTATLGIDKAFTVQVLRFRVLVFVSMCCVLIYYGVEKSLVDRAMRLCISQSVGKNLDCLRRGASWVNRRICTLGSAGLDHRASELFVLCKSSNCATITSIQTYETA